MRKLPHWCITDKFPAIYDTESATAIEMTAKLYGAMKELVGEYNKFVDNVNVEIEEFETSTEKDIELFKISIRQEFQDFIDTVELKLQSQDKEIADAIAFMKTNLTTTIKRVVAEMQEQGELNDAILSTLTEITTAIGNEKTARENADTNLQAAIGNEKTARENTDTNLQTAIDNEKTARETADTNLQTAIDNEKTARETAIVNLTKSIDILKHFATPDNFGAKGDGVADDTTALQSAFNFARANNVPVLFNRKGVYLISSMLTIPNGVSVDFNNSTIKASTTFASVNENIPDNVMIYIEECNGSVKQSDIKNVKIQGNNLEIALFLGANEKLESSIGSTNGRSPQMVSFANMDICNVATGLHIREAWQCSFFNINTVYITNFAILIDGQAVNNNFVNCQFWCGNSTAIALRVASSVYGLKPEGFNFTNCNIGHALKGVSLGDCLAFHFTNCIIDLVSSYAVDGIGERIKFVSCWIFTYGSIAVNIDPIGVLTNNSSTQFSHCDIIADGENPFSVKVDFYNTGVIVEGCQLSGKVWVNNNSLVTFIGNCFKGQTAPFTGDGWYNLYGNTIKNSFDKLTLPTNLLNAEETTNA